VRQSLTESLTVSLAGGALALLVGAAAARLLVALTFGRDVTVPITTSPGGRVLGFTFALSCAAAVLFGLLPAIRARGDLMDSLRVRASATRFRLGKVLVVAQVAISLVLLAVAGSFAWSLAAMTGQRFGFNPERALVVTVDPRLARYEFEQLGSLYERIESQLRSVPGVTGVGLSYYSPFHGCCWSYGVAVPGHTPREGDSTQTLLNRVSPGYFEAIGTAIRQGRAFDERDASSSRLVVVVNETFVRRFLPGGSAIGRTFRVESQPADVEIVGVVEDAKYDSPSGEVVPMAFFPLLQVHADVRRPSGDYGSNFIETIAVRTSGDPMVLAAPVRRALAAVDPDLPVLGLESMREHIGRGLNAERTATTIAGVSALLAMLLACIGLYGVMAYLVQGRTRDLGIRVALGAARGSVLGSLMRETLAQAAAGIAFGLPLAFAASRNITVGSDPPASGQALAIAVVLLVAALALAGYVPARRASRLDPAVVLRGE
jgi:predicted permease